MKFPVVIAFLLLASALSLSAGQMQNRNAYGVRGQAAVGYVAPTNGLVAWWSFTGNANDNWGANNGTVYNAALTNGHKGASGTAYYFNGSTAYISVPDTAGLRLTTWSVSCWVKTTNTADLIMIQKGSAATRNYSIHNGYANFTKGNSFTGTAILYPVTVRDGNWHHLVVTLSGTSGYAYVDGGTNKASTVVSPCDTPTDILAIGRAGSSSGDYFQGFVDEVRIYNIALSVSDVAKLYNAEKP